MARRTRDYTIISREEWNELNTLAKRANQRLASATPGQRRALEYYQPEKFSRAFPQSAAEYQQRMREVERFLSAKQTTRTGWAEIKQKAVESAGETLRNERKYDLTDEELANVFKEVGDKSRKQFYKVLDLVQAKKYDAQAKGQEFAEDELQQAINQAVRSHMSAGDAIRRKMAALERYEGTAVISSGSLRSRKK